MEASFFRRRIRLSPRVVQSVVELKVSSTITRKIDVYASLPFAINDTDLHCSGVQIDAAVKSVLLLLESHHRSPERRNG